MIKENTLEKQKKNEFCLYVRNLQDDSIHEVNKYLKNKDGEISIWTNSWYGRHVIGQDCEFEQKNNYTFEPEQYSFALIKATKEQLNEIGISEDISGVTVKVYDIDKYIGMYSPCSRIIVYNKNSYLSSMGVNSDYIFPTRWLSFLNI